MLVVTGAAYVAGKEILGIYSDIKDLQIERRKIEYNNARLGRVNNNGFIYKR